MTNRPPPSDAGEPWQVSSEPILSIGGVASDDGHLVWHVQGAARLSDGRIAMLMRRPASPRVLVFGPDGQFLNSIGGPGDGPGEFVEPMFLQYHPGDSLSVWERFYGRVTTFDSFGTVLGTRYPNLTNGAGAANFGGGSTMVLPLPDGSFIAEGRHPPTPRHLRPTGTWIREPITYVRMRRDHTADTLGTFLGATRGYASREDAVPLPLLFGKDSSVAAAGQNGEMAIYISNGDSHTVQVFGEEGRLERIIRLDLPPVPVTDAERRTALRRFAMINQMDSDGIAQYEEALSEFPPVTTHPPMRFMHVDRIDHLWTFQQRDAQDRLVWNVFDPEGTWLARVAVPLFRVLEIGSDFILGLEYDAQRVESVHMYSLTRGSPDP